MRAHCAKQHKAKAKKQTDCTAAPDRSARLAGDIGIKPVGIEDRAVEEAVRAEIKELRGRADRNHLFQRAFHLGVGRRHGHADPGHHRAVDVRPVALARCFGVRGGMADVTAAHHLRIEPQGVALPGKGRGAGMRLEEITPSAGN